MPSFSHLHVHTQYSLLDGAAPIKKLVKKAKEDNMPAIAITDHGNMFGAFEFYESVKDAGLKPILGCEFYVVEDRFKQQFLGTTKDKRYHQLILAKDPAGYANLSKLCSLGYLEGMYSKYPRIDKSLIEQYHSGLIATTCCLGAEVPQAIMYKGEEAAEEIFCWWHKLFGDNYYVELQRHHLQNCNGQGMSQEDVNQVLIKFARKYDVKIIATNDSHYVEQEDFNSHDILLCINTGEFQATPKATEEESGKGTRFGFPNDEFFFKTTKEMEYLFKDIPEAIDNTNLVIDTIETPSLKRDVILPNYTMPEGFNDQGEYLRHLTWEGAMKKYKGEIPDIVRERLEFELKAICDSPFPGYFLIVQDFTTAAREMGVWVGPGRGSAAGSQVAYVLGITNVDAVKHNLLFERFINPERVGLPDIDIDFDDIGRERVFDYVAKKYGERRMAQIITYGTMAAKSSIRDVGRVLQLPLSETDKIAKLIPNNMKLAEIFSKKPEEFAKDEDRNLSPDDIDALKQLHQFYGSPGLPQQVLTDAIKLEGSVRNTGIHACGIIIAPQDLTEFVPVSKSKESNYMQVQFDVNVIEKVGLLKMDFLGLSTLTILKDSVELIRQTKGIELDLDEIPMDDEKTYQLFQRGDTIAIFQFESPGMQKYLKDLKPTRLDDLIAMNALYRPGPLKYIPDFINRRHGRTPVVYDLPEMQEYLEETYGITVYQEQVMLLSQKIAGFTKGKADELRKAMGKKKRDLIDELRGLFMEGALAKGYDQKILEKIYSDWEEFAAYAFNKSHSTCYAYLAYKTAYLKANYPQEFMSAVLKNSMGDIKKITFFMEECRRMGITVLGPDINESRGSFSITPRNEIRFGMNAIKGVGENAVEDILLERDENGPFSSIFDVVTRVSLKSVNKKTLDALSRAGAFDFDNRYHRAQYFLGEDGKDSGIELALKYGTRIQQQKAVGQGSLFGAAENNFVEEEPKLPQVPELSVLDECREEEQVVGIYLSKHPMDEYKFEYENIVSHNLNEFSELQFAKTQTPFQIMGIITSVKESVTKKGEAMARFSLMDFVGNQEITVWPKDWVRLKNMINKDSTVVVRGAASYNSASDKTYINLTEITFASELGNFPFAKNLNVYLPMDSLNYASILEEMMHKEVGNTRLIMNFFDKDDNLQINVPSKKLIKYNSELKLALEDSEIKFKLELNDKWRWDNIQINKPAGKVYQN